jgi:hypothetical protein
MITSSVPRFYDRREEKHGWPWFLFCPLGRLWALYRGWEIGRAR